MKPAIDGWTSYLFASPSKPALPSLVTCVEFFHRAQSKTTLLFQAEPHSYGVFDATTMKMVGKKHPLDAPVRLARFLDDFPDKLLPDLLLVTNRLCIVCLESNTIIKELTLSIATKDIVDIRASANIIAVLSPRVIHLLDRKSDYEVTATIPTAADAMALGSRWLAYPSSYEEIPLNSFTSSSSATFIPREDYSLSNVAHGVASSLYFLSQVGRKSLGSASEVAKDAGSVVVHDIQTGKPLVQFKAHDSPITTLTFDPSGLLLITSSTNGQTLHVHRLLGNDHILLYKLQRGITYARIHHVSVSMDSKWIAVTSLRGTTHVYAISPEGGPVQGHCHADINYDDEAHVTTSKIVKSFEEQSRSLGRLHLSTEKIQPLVRLRHNIPGLSTPSATGLQLDEDDLQSLVLKCQWAPNNTLYIANAGNLKSMKLLPKLDVVQSKFVLSAELSVLQNVDLEHREVHPTCTEITSEKYIINNGIEVRSHYRSSTPLWVHPKVSFRAVTKATNDSLVLSVRRIGPIPIATDAEIQERVTQGESPVFDGAEKEEVFVPTLDLAASISIAVHSRVNIEPQDKQISDTDSSSINLTHIQDTYFASPPMLPVVTPASFPQVLEESLSQSPEILEEIAPSVPSELSESPERTLTRSKRERRKKQKA
ncbi:hypothetical protein THRCLA_06148 [Thraustotheca clavata]|uniref:BCAS3 WD40 domain-containing protein n=1 Tax=Thraustotheca clavata TaxID=74557 RepID=A0A1V9ZQ99_9STRA|nr:hypothetical protein THRCLA_06148 [Thraustotheca clavata]